MELEIFDQHQHFFSLGIYIRPLTLGTKYILGQVSLSHVLMSLWKVLILGYGVFSHNQSFLNFSRQFG